MAKKQKFQQQPQKKSHTGLAILLLFFQILVMIVAGFLMFVYWPSEPQPELNVNPINTKVYSSLVAVGIEDAIVDAQQERVVILYRLPATLDKETSWFYVFGAAAVNSPGSEKVVIQALINDAPTEKVTASVADITAARVGTLTEQEFRSKLIFE